LIEIFHQCRPHLVRAPFDAITSSIADRFKGRYPPGAGTTGATCPPTDVDRG
jgi:hypothetical protein